MALTLHSLKTRHLRGALTLASLVGFGAAVLLRNQLGYELMVAVAWDLAVLFFIIAMIWVTWSFDEAQMT
jgi:hypothetical protein